VGAGSVVGRSVASGAVDSGVVSTGDSVVSSVGVVDSGVVVSVGVALSDVEAVVDGAVVAGACAGSLDRLGLDDPVPVSAAVDGSGGLTNR
jgi:hypothetical protein